MSKKDVRAAFRRACFERDGYRCAMCGWRPDRWDDENPSLDAHHVTDRNLMPFGGYVKQNGISLCDECHLMAEIYHSTGTSHPGYSPEDLYSKIESSHDLAFEFSLYDLGGYSERNISDWRRLVIQAQGGESVVALALESPINSTTWELSCEGQGITDSMVLLYGKGRYYGN